MHDRTASPTNLGSSCPSASGTGPRHEDQRRLVLVSHRAVLDPRRMKLVYGGQRRWPEVGSLMVPRARVLV